MVISNHTQGNTTNKKAFADPGLYDNNLTVNGQRDQLTTSVTQ